MAKAKITPERYEKEVRKKALALPGVSEDDPWGKIAFKVKGKIFVGMKWENDDTELLISLKLPESHLLAFTLPHTEPTHGGLGKKDWVSVRLGAKASFPLPVLLSWIEESFAAVGGKK